MNKAQVNSQLNLGQGKKKKDNYIDSSSCITLIYFAIYRYIVSTSPYLKFFPSSATVHEELG
jgi:hypothetical protein